MAVSGAQKSTAGLLKCTMDFAGDRMRSPSCGCSEEFLSESFSDILRRASLSDDARLLPARGRQNQ